MAHRRGGAAGAGHGRAARRQRRSSSTAAVHGLRRAQARPEPGEVEVTTGTASLVPDSDGRDGWTLYINGVPSSHVDLDDPLRLDFEYIRWMAMAIDRVEPQGAGIRAAHLGGAGCTLPRYIAATRPDSRQVVLELDPAVLEYAKNAFGLRSGRALRLRAIDGRAGLTEMPQACQDVVLRDAFSGSQVPTHLTTLEFIDQVRRVLAPGGVYLANIADSQRLDLARGEAATALQRFEHVVLVAEHGHFSGRRYGNVVLGASDRPFEVQALTRALACDAVRAKLLAGSQVEAFVAGAAPSRDPRPDGPPASA